MIKILFSKEYSYSPLWRFLEITFLTVFFSLIFILIPKLISRFEIFTFTMALVSSWLFSDFTSGFVHFLFDTFGGVKTPLLGPSLIRTFREHHSDPKLITHHDFIELNGSNALATLPLLLYCRFASPTSFVFYFLFFLCLFTLWTNIIHKWAHLDEHELNPLIKGLQKSGIILSPSVHKIHHTPPYDKYFCITNGHLNEPIEKCKLFRFIEQVFKK